MYIVTQLEEYLLDCKIRNLSPKTIKSIKNDCLLFFKFLEENNITEIEKTNNLIIKQYILQKKEMGNSDRYLNGVIKSLRGFYKYAKDNDYIPINPMLKINWLKEEKCVIKTYSDADIKKILKYYNNQGYLNIRNKTIVYMIIDTGIRCSELCDLKFNMVSIERILIHGKGNKQRFVSCSPMLAKQLIKYRQAYDKYFKGKVVKYDNLFLSRTGLPLTVETVERIFKTIENNTDIDDTVRCSPHTFRHYFAQAQLRNGLDVYSLSRLLGHENISITQRYLQGLNDENVLDMAVKFSPLMNL